jgi:hypothetical protein
MSLLLAVAQQAIKKRGKIVSAALVRVLLSPLYVRTWNCFSAESRTRSTLEADSFSPATVSLNNLPNTWEKRKKESRSELITHFKASDAQKLTSNDDMASH